MRPSLPVWLLSVCFGLSLTGTLPAQIAPPKAPSSSPKEKSQPLPQFEDLAQKAGLTVPHISSTDKKYIVESMSGGVGLIDCDNDGKLDIITVNGSTVQRYRAGGDLMITLYHQDSDLNNGDPHFTDITTAAGLTHKGWGMGV
ncbi:MAG: VCBS repeat-containing protein, partial [Candidatus Sulfotelmatobacter sp.]